jgi:L-alanine-DL-glutamate epimerase-like enolase superfamily enzyme
MWDQMFRATMFYGRKGLPIAAISAVDLALWDLLGKIRKEPVYKMIGGATKVGEREGGFRKHSDSLL